MSIWELLILAVGLSMDALAVAVCKGLAMQRIHWRGMLTVGLWFGGFQALMPLVGYLLGAQFKDKITKVDHWVAFGLLALIGVNMLREAFAKEEEAADGSLSFTSMLPLAVATSIDALAVGVTFALLPVNIWKAIALIGLTTLCLSMAGVKIGNAFGARYKRKAEFAGGAILILLGLKILLEHLGIL